MKLSLILTLICITAAAMGLALSCTEHAATTPVTTISTKWEYKVVYVDALTHIKMGDAAMELNGIDLVATDLDGYGKDGWELATSYLEPETAYPNLSENPKYVTGLQPNVRPKRVVLLFKRLMLQ
jgi:hypothetical protein